MTDLVVTVPMGQWESWLEEGDLPGDRWTRMRSHFWFGGGLPDAATGDRIYVVAFGKLRGYAPLIEIEAPCSMRRDRNCLMRYGNAVAVTIPEPIRGFQGWRYRHWDRAVEVPFPDWRTV